MKDSFKTCECGYNTGKSAYNFCPLCGEKLKVFEKEEDGTYNTERMACRIINDDWVNPNIIYYYKVSPICDGLCWIYKNPNDKHFFMGCHISHIRPCEIERVYSCIFHRQNGKCGSTKSCDLCLPKLKKKYQFIEF